MIKYLFILLIMLSSCGSLVSIGENDKATKKEIRKANRCERKLNRLVRKCPSLKTTLIIQDTVPVEIVLPPVYFQDTISVPFYYTDTIYSDTTLNDSVKIINNTIIKYPDFLEYEFDKGLINMSYTGNGLYSIKLNLFADTIAQDVPVEVTADTIQPIKYIEKELTGFKKFMLISGWVIWILLIIIIGLLVLKIFGKISIPFMLLILMSSCKCEVIPASSITTNSTIYLNGNTVIVDIIHVSFIDYKCSKENGMASVHIGSNDDSIRIVTDSIGRYILFSSELELENYFENKEWICSERRCIGDQGAYYVFKKAE